MGRERRAYQRHPIHWEATVKGVGLQGLAVIIRDFCSGGLLLAPRGETFEGRLPWLHHSIQVSFRDPSGNGDHDVTARVARVDRKGIGVSFGTARQAVFDSLFTLIEPDDEPEPTAAPSATISRLAGDVIRICREEAEAFTESTLSDFMAHSVDEQFERARSAGSNDEQNAFFAGFRRLREVRREFPQRFQQALLARIDSVTAPPAHRRKKTTTEAPSQASELALVDEREFEDWLSRSEVINRAESRFRGPLDALNRRLTYAVAHRIDDESNPLGPSSLCELLAESAPVDKLEQPAAQALYDIFGRIVLRAAGNLYETVNQRLRERDVLPNVENEKPQLRPIGDHAAETPSGDDEPAPTDADAQAVAEPTAPPPPGSAYAGQSSGVRLNWERGGPSMAARAQPAPSSAPGPREQTAATPGSASSMTLPAASQILDAQRQLRAARAQAASDGSPPVSAPRATFEPAEVVEAVDRLHGELQGPTRNDGHGSLLDRVMQTLSPADGKALAPEAQDTVELMDSWFSDVEENDLNTDFLREWSGRLAVLALKGQLESGSFLRSDPQPIHELLNQLDRAGVALATLRGKERQQLHENLERLLTQGTRDARKDPEIIGKTATEIAALIDKPLATRAVNMQKVLQQCEGSQRLERAKHFVDQEIDKRIAQREIPKLLLDLIDQGWRNLLVLIHLRNGVQSDPWRRGLAVVDRLLAAMGTGKTPGRPIAEPKKVLAYIDKQFTAFGRLTPAIKRLLGEIGDYVLAVCRDGRPPHPLAMALAQPRAASIDEAGTNIAPRWLGQAKLLKVGDWVFFSGRKGTPEPLRLQWCSEDRSRYVFVNRSGLKAREVSMIELAQQLEATAAGLAEDLDMPLTDRQWQKKLHQMHEEMVRYATRDALTGVFNRKAFLRELKRMPHRVGGKRRSHALLYVSLDGFKVINGTVGHDSGDRLLRHVAEQLTGATGEHGFVGRMGGDEFAVLLADCTAEEAETIARQRLEALKAYRIVSDQGSLSTSASLGLVTFAAESASYAALIKDADEACLMAKQAGGNRIHVVSQDDNALKQLRSSMERAALVDSALDSGELRLRCQRIEPIAKDLDRKPFYEVLLTIEAFDEFIPPDEFIPAAERFGRMTTVDRWVIRELLDWCAAHPQALDNVFGFTVNLSGPTLNDASFARFLREQFARTGVSGKKICFEVTETAAVQNLARAADLIEEVKALGCLFSLDDFGTGLSSYSYLKNLPVEYLKIDGQFVKDIDRDEADHAMVKSITELGHFLGKRTIAEYVENDTILTQLRDIGLDYVQGFGVGRPLPIDELLE